MLYKLKNGRSVSIPTKEVENLMSSLEISQDEAVELWLTDNGLEENEEQTELDEKASKVHINKDAYTDEGKKPRKKPEIKVSSEKKALFDSILTNLTRCEGVERENIKVLNENKLISVEINGITFKIDLIQCRKGKKKA